MTLAPKLSGNISVRQPTAPTQSAGLTLAGFGLEAIGAIGQARQGEVKAPKESELKQQALIPLANDLESLRNSDLSDSQFNKQARLRLRSFIQENPQYAGDARNLASDMYGATEPVLEESAVDLVTADRNEWFTTPEGQTALVKSAVYGPNGALDEQATMAKAVELHAKSNASKAEVERSNRELKLVENNSALLGKKREQIRDRNLPLWTDETRDIQNSLVEGISNGIAELDSPQEQMQAINSLRSMQESVFLERAQSMGLPAEIYEPMIEDALRPLDTLRNLALTNMEDDGKLIAAYRTARQAGLEDTLISVLGPLAAFPEGREGLAIAFSRNMFSNERIENTLKALEGADLNDPLKLFNFVPSGGDAKAVIETSSTETGTVDPAAVQEIKTKQAADSSYIPDTIDGVANVLGGLNTDIPQEKLSSFALGQVGQLSALASASPQPLSGDILDKVFSPSSLNVLKRAMSGSTQEAKDLQGSMEVFAGMQFRRNLQIAISADEDAAMWRIVQKDGVYSLQTVEGGPVTLTGLENSGLEKAKRAVANLNKINTYMGNVDPQWNSNISDSFANLVATNTERREPFAGQTPEDRGNMAPMLEILDRTEGGGDYDTLFGFSQRPGNPMAGVKVSEMTIGELKEFSASDGEYGRWTKSKLGYLATPMGRFQIVGTTLRDTAEKMGIPDDAVFTPEVQNAMFHFLARQALSGTNGSPARKRQAMRAVWEGFKHVSDTELDYAIAAFENASPPDYEIIQGQERIRAIQTGVSKQQENLQAPEVSTGSVSRPETRSGGSGTVTPSEVPFTSSRGSSDRATGRSEGARTASEKTTATKNAQVLERMDRLMQEEGLSNEDLMEAIRDYLQSSGR